MIDFLKRADARRLLSNLYFAVHEEMYEPKDDPKITRTTENNGIKVTVIIEYKEA